MELLSTSALNTSTLRMSDVLHQYPHINDATEVTDQTNALIQIPNTKISYYPLKNIGQGATSTVHLGSFGDTNSKITAAIKMVKQECYEILKNELQIWKLLLSDSTGSSNHVVRLFDWGQFETSYSRLETKETIFVFAMEPANYNLRRYIISNPLPSPYHAKSLCHDVATGLNFLHLNKILHRDIKPENVLIFQTDKTTVAKLGDFGISSTINQGTTHTTAHGTELWMSPEALKSLHEGKKFKNTKSVDIFSLGMTMYFALSKGKHPFSYSVKHGSFPEMNIKDPAIGPPKLSCSPNHTEMDLLDWMLQKDPLKRPSVQQVLLHPLFWSKQKCLDFVCFIARTNNDKANPKCQQLRNDIENEYQEFHQSMFTEKLQWKLDMDKRLFERKGNGRKNYSDNAIFSLIELIRDKREHYCDMVDNLMNQRFTVDGCFSEEKYIDYFMELFPYLLKFLFASFIKRRNMFRSDLNDVKTISSSFSNISMAYDAIEEKTQSIVDRKFGKGSELEGLEQDSQRELKCIGVQTIQSFTTTIQISNVVVNQFDENDYDHWEEEDYNRWDNQEDDYDPPDDYDPRYDEPEDDHDPPDDYDPRYDEPEDDYDPSDDYDPRYDEPQDDYDPPDDYDPRYDEPQDDYDPPDDYDPRYDEPQDDYDPRSDYDQQQLRLFFQKCFDKLCYSNMQFNKQNMMEIETLYVQLSGHDFQSNLVEFVKHNHDHWAALTFYNWYEEECNQWYHNVF